MANQHSRLENWIGFFFALFLFVACSTQQRLSKAAHNSLLDKKNLLPANIGIAVFDPANNHFLYNYQADHYFIPASNTKLFSLYAGLKYLPDSLIAARVSIDEGVVLVQATGDPTFLHPDFPYQPLLKFLQKPGITSVRLNTPFASTSFGKGWAWDDYPYDYMAERDPFPMYGNVATISFNGDSIRTIPPSIKPFVIGTPVKGKRWNVTRQLAAHFYIIDTTSGSLAPTKTITMAMERGLFASRYLSDTLDKEVVSDHSPLHSTDGFPIYSQPKDSLFKIMMHRSDNFFAEQTLLMAANEYLGEMNDARMIDTLLKTDLKDLPQKPRWVDGSGLSRYNLFSPKDFIWILKKLEDDFGLERMKTILPGANEGTLEGLYKGYEKHIYAKTGTVSNNLALSGYLITRKNQQYIFSIMVNNHQAINSEIRKGMQRFLTSIIDKY
ncbi:MAG: D-alanyl-D-alanine carboxypeptidase [Bacteroidota bacterium]|nr:D-alanyl-D-alanine carboxypeptidase [Bacteroidota bacterium]